ncbi:hypothetical protein pb186bvf_020731 [Paramecium bursaria]
MKIIIIIIIISSMKLGKRSLGIQFVSICLSFKNLTLQILFFLFLLSSVFHSIENLDVLTSDLYSYHGQYKIILIIQNSQKYSNLCEFNFTFARSKCNLFQEIKDSMVDQFNRN